MPRRRCAFAPLAASNVQRSGMVLYHILFKDTDCGGADAKLWHGNNLPWYEYSMVYMYEYTVQRHRGADANGATHVYTCTQYCMYGIIRETDISHLDQPNIS